MSQAKLLVDRRFWPLFWTQFFGAFNDNLFKNAVVILVTFRSMTLGGMGSASVVAMSAGIFILPFFLFSGIAGQLSDRYSKPVLMQWVKALEIVIMGGAAAGFLLENLLILLLVLFLMGTHSTFFGPAKFSILPELIEEKELVGANALVETGTFVAILLGTIGGGVLVGMEGGTSVVSVALLAVAITGYWTSRKLMPLTPAAPSLSLTWNPITPTVDTMKSIRSEASVLHSVMGISWFWFIGASILTILPPLCKDVLRAGEGVVTLFLALFCVGIALGSLLCERLSRQTLEIGLVPLGSIGLTLFAVDAFLAAEQVSAALPLATVGEFLSRGLGSYRLAADLFLFSVFGGFFTVPLYTLIQERSNPAQRSRVVAANNILNAAFMVVASGLLMGMLALGVSIPAVFLVLGLMNAAVAMYIYTLIPEFLLRFIAWGLANVLYRIRIEGRERFPVTGPALLVCNHVSFVDWLLIAAACPRPARFIMYWGYFKIPVVQRLFRDAKVIPIAPAKEDVAVRDKALEQAAHELVQGELVCIFPEGGITSDGEVMGFRPGLETILQKAHEMQGAQKASIPVIPMALVGMWGSFFSRKDGSAMKRPFRRVWSRVLLRVGEPMAAGPATAPRLEEAVRALLSDVRQ